MLAQYKPALAWKCFSQPDGGGHRDIDSVFGVIQGLPLLPNEDGAALLESIFEQIDSSEDHFMKGMLLGELLSSGSKVDGADVMAIARSLLDNASDKRSLEQALKLISVEFFSTNVYQHNNPSLSAIHKEAAQSQRLGGLFGFCGITSDTMRYRSTVLRGDHPA